METPTQSQKERQRQLSCTTDHLAHQFRYHVGQADAHIVFEAETVGLTLAASLLATEPAFQSPSSFIIKRQSNPVKTYQRNRDTISLGGFVGLSTGFTARHRRVNGRSPCSGYRVTKVIQATKRWIRKSKRLPKALRTAAPYNTSHHSYQRTVSSRASRKLYESRENCKEALG